MGAPGLHRVCDGGRISPFFSFLFPFDSDTVHHRAFFLCVQVGLDSDTVHHLAFFLCGQVGLDSDTVHHLVFFALWSSGHAIEDPLIT